MSAKEQLTVYLKSHPEYFEFSDELTEVNKLKKLVEIEKNLIQV